MKLAVAFNIETKRARSVSPEDFQEIVKAGQDKNWNLFSPLFGTPLVFKPGYWRSGRKRYIGPHFARAVGYGLKGHVFNRDQHTESIGETLDNGGIILASLNMGKALYSIDFGEMETAKAAHFVDWLVENHGNYKSVSVKNAQQIVALIQTVHAHQKAKGRTVNGSLCVLSQGVVQRYEDFYLGQQDEKITAVHTNLFAEKDGVKIGDARMIGPPKLLHFVPTKSTFKEKGARGLKGNMIFLGDSYEAIINQLIFQQEDIRHTKAYQDLWQELHERREEGVYVLASPSITVDPEARLEAEDVGHTALSWYQTRWLIMDIDTQIATVGKSSEVKPGQQMDLRPTG